MILKNLALKVCITILVLLTVTGLLFAQFKISLNSTVNYDGNILRSYNSDADYIMVPEIDIQYLSDVYEVTYTGYFQILKNARQFNNQTHSFYLDFFNEISFSTSLSYGGSWQVRIDEPEYDYFDYNLFSGYFSSRFYPRPWFLINTEIELLNRRFPEEPLWNHLELGLSTHFSFSLPTRSTLLFEASYLRRDFQPQLVESIEESEGGMGHGGMHGGPNLVYTKISKELPTLYQLVLNSRFAQSLLPSVGGYLEFSYCYNPTKGNPYNFEIESFSPIDDYFGYGESRFTTNLKMKRGNWFDLQLNYQQYKRHYLNRPVYLYDFETETWVMENDQYVIVSDSRKDRGFLVNVTSSLSFNNLFLKPSRIRIEIFYIYQDNRSNDPYFSFDNSVIGTSINYGFQY